MSDAVVQNLKSKIKQYPDFPKKGILFEDLTPIYEDANAFEQLINQAVLQLQKQNCKLETTLVAGIEARGFILGSALAREIGRGFFPIRKAGKFPGETIQESYDLEYGQATIEIQKHDRYKGDSVIIVDDVYATGGTMNAAIKLMKKVNLSTIFVLLMLDIGISDIEKLPCVGKVVLLK